MKLYAKMQKIFDMTKLWLAKVGALLRIIQKETVSVLTQPPAICVFEVYLITFLVVPSLIRMMFRPFAGVGLLDPSMP